MARQMLYTDDFETHINLWQVSYFMDTKLVGLIIFVVMENDRDFEKQKNFMLHISSTTFFVVKLILLCNTLAISIRKKIQLYVRV